MPRVPYELIRKPLHESDRALLEQHTYLWAGQLGKLEITPHRVDVKVGARSIRSQPYRTGFHNRQYIAEQVANQTELGVIEPSQSE